jgi:putative N-acetylmannosamine-6-phosphate epimerase
MVAAHWVEVVAIEASASRRSDVRLENLVAASETESGALILALAASSFGVA